MTTSRMILRLLAALVLGASSARADIAPIWSGAVEGITDRNLAVVGFLLSLAALATLWATRPAARGSLPRFYRGVMAASLAIAALAWFTTHYDGAWREREEANRVRYRPDPGSRPEPPGTRPPPVPGQRPVDRGDTGSGPRPPG